MHFVHALYLSGQVIEFDLTNSKGIDSFDTLGSISCVSSALCVLNAQDATISPTLGGDWQSETHFCLPLGK